MRLLYTLGIRAYAFGIRLACPFNTKAKLLVKGRKEIFDKLPTPALNRKTVWIHTASLGEFEQARPVIEALKQQNPDVYIHLTFFSPSGYEVRKNYHVVDSISYLPVDTPKQAKRFIEQLQPSAAIFVKYEYWYNFMKQLSNKKIPLIMVSAIFRENQVFFKTYGKWFAKQLQLVEHFYVQTEKSRELLSQINISAHTRSGDTRFDRVLQVASNPDSYPDIQNFKGDKSLWIAGSTWPKDEEVIAEIYKKIKNKVQLIIAPHEIHEAHLKQIEKAFSIATTVRFSYYDATKNDQAEVLIIDSIGKLMHLYQYGDWAYIGGGFHVGIHNILEAATFGLPVIFGPNYEKFNEAKDLIQKGGAWSISSSTELEPICMDLSDNLAFRDDKSKICKSYVADQSGATSIILKHPSLNF